MKTQMIKNILTIGLGLLLSTQVMVSCSKKEGGSKKKIPVVVNPNPWGTGVPGSGVLARTTSETSVVALNATFSILLDLYSQNPVNGQAGNYMNYQDPKLVTYYSGMVSANGQLTVNGSNGQCGVTPGVYSITTVSPGQIGMGVVSNLRVQATNGVTQILMTVANGILYNSTDPNGTNSASSSNRMGGEIWIESIRSTTVMMNQGGCSGSISLY